MKICAKHSDSRRTSDGRCVGCESQRRTEYRARNLEREQARRLAYRERERELERARRQADPEPSRARTRRWSEAHPDKVRANNALQYASNIEGNKARVKAWRRANPEKNLERVKAWVKANPEKVAKIRAAGAKRHRAKYPERVAARTRLYQVSKRQAVPRWANRTAMLAFYAEARKLTQETGMSHHVDHIVPINHPNVCGLHVEANLQVLPASDNVRKGNRYWPDAMALSA